MSVHADKANELLDQDVSPQAEGWTLRAVLFHLLSAITDLEGKVNELEQDMKAIFAHSHDVQPIGLGPFVRTTTPLLDKGRSSGS